MSIQTVRAALTSTYVTDLVGIKARQLARRPEFRRTDPADIAQDLIGAVLEQAHRFDPARAAVVTFIARVVDSAAAMLVRHYRRLKRWGGTYPESLDAGAMPEDGKETPLVETLLEEDAHRHRGGDSASDLAQWEMAQDVAGALASLEPDSQAIARRLMRGDNEAAIARDLGISRRQTRKAFDAIGAQLQRAGLAGI